MKLQIEVEVLPPLLFISLRMGDKLLVRIDNSSPKPFNILVAVLENLVYAECEHQAKIRHQGSNLKMSVAGMLRLWNNTVRRFPRNSSLLPTAWRERKKVEAMVASNTSNENESEDAEHSPQDQNRSLDDSEDDSR